MGLKHSFIFSIELCSLSEPVFKGVLAISKKNIENCKFVHQLRHLSLPGHLKRYIVTSHDAAEKQITRENWSWGWFKSSNKVSVWTRAQFAPRAREEIFRKRGNGRRDWEKCIIRWLSQGRTRSGADYSSLDTVPADLIRGDRRESRLGGSIGVMTTTIRRARTKPDQTSQQTRGENTLEQSNPAHITNPKKLLHFTVAVVLNFLLK